jgi:hypothetical protein
MSKKTLNTYQFPDHLLREYHKLMSNKSDFLKKLSSADQRKLETLYDKLNVCWNRNGTNKLLETLNQKYSELRKIQEENNSDWTNYETSIASEELKNIRKDEKLLEKTETELEGESTTVSGTIAEIEFQLEELDSRGETTRYTIEEEQRAMESLGRQIEFVERDEEREREQFEQSKADIERETGTEEEAIDQIPIRVAEEGERLEKDFRKRTESLSEQIETTSFDEEGVRRELSRKYPQDREEYLDRISTGDYERKWYAAEFNALGKIHAAVKAYKVSHEEHSRVMGRN